MAILSTPATAPAPNRATLYNVEDAVETAVKAILTDGGLTHCFMQRESGDLPDARVDIQLQLGAAYNEREYAWNARLVFNVRTERTTAGGTAHGQLRGAIRDLMPRVPPGKQEHPSFTVERLPFHIVKKLTHASTDPQVNIEDDVDLSPMAFDMVVSVRRGAFPVDGLTTEEGELLTTEGGDILLPE